MRAHSVFEYAVIRVVPRVERGEFVNVGVVLFSRTQRFLAARIALDQARLLALSPDIDVAAVEEQLGYISRVCQGGAGAGPIGELPPQERFRWLTAPRSTIIQPSPVHSGVSHDLQAALERLFVTSVMGG